MRPLVILNPRAGGERAVKRWERARAAAEEALGPCDVRETRGPGDGRCLALDAVTEGRELVVAAGGDGTVSEVADGLLGARGDDVAGRGPALGILPCGTGSDAARAFGVPSDVVEAARRLANPALRRFDAGRVRFVRHDGRAAAGHFVNGVTLGEGGVAAARAGGSSKRFGARITYLMAAAPSILAPARHAVRFRADGVDLGLRQFHLAGVGNGCCSGGGMNLYPGARPDDGLLCFVVVPVLGLAHRLIRFPWIYAGTWPVRTIASITSVRRIDAAPARDGDVVPLEVDGETPGRLPATLEVLPGALEILGASG